MTNIMTNIVWALAAVSTVLPSSVADLPTCRDVAPERIAVGGPPDTLVARPAASRIHWKGMKFAGLGAHEGDVKLVGGMLVLRHQQLTGGSFTIDMRSIDVTDIPASDRVSRQKLRTRLLSADVFDTAHFPTAVFAATGAKRTGDSTWQVAGTLSLRGVTRPITFSTDVRWAEVGHMVATANLVLDRQQWGIVYRDSRIVNDLVDDDIQLAITLDARRRGTVVARR
jgi:polyisoprenoid-binding protein YceI